MKHTLADCKAYCELWPGCSGFTYTDTGNSKMQKYCTGYGDSCKPTKVSASASYYKRGEYAYR